MLSSSILMRGIALFSTILIYGQTGKDTRSAISHLTYIAGPTRIHPTILEEGFHRTSMSNSSSFFAKAPMDITLCTWVGGSSGNWEVPSNWSCSQVPTANNNVEILVGTVTVNSNADVKTLKIGSSGGIIVTSGRTLTVHE